MRRSTTLLAILFAAACSNENMNGKKDAAPMGAVDAPVVVDAAADSKPPADAAVDTPPVSAPPMVGPAILPVVQLFIPGVVVETLGAVPFSGELRMIQDHDGTHMDLATRPLSFYSRAGIATRTPAYPAGARTFTLEIRDGSGKAVTDGLLGLPYQGEWTLAPCWSDKTCMRNLLGFSVGAAVGTGAPRARFVEVFFNGDYQGLYQLQAPARQGQGRVEIPAPPGAAGEALTGAYVFRREGLGESLASALPPLDWLSPTTAPGTWPHQILYTYIYPVATALSMPQRDYLRGHVAAFEEAMKAASWADPALGYRAWIDTQSWQDFVVLSEVTNNVDGYWKNGFLTKQRDVGDTRGKLVMTPLWDFTIGFGNANYRQGWRPDKPNYASQLAAGGECADPEWLPRVAPLCDANCCMIPNCRPPARCWNMPYIPFWWERLQGDASFRNETRCRYRELRKTGGPLDITKIDASIADWKAQIGPNAIARHVTKWPQLLRGVFPNPYGIDPRTAPVPMATPMQFFDKEVMWFRDWVDQRLKWLDVNLPGTCATDGDVTRPPMDGGPPPPPDKVELTRGLIGYWKFNETTGTMAVDSSPAHNDATLMNSTGTEWTPSGYKQGALSFDPMKRNVAVVANNPSINPTMGITIAAWVNSTDWLGNRRLMQKGDGDNQFRLLEENGVLVFHLTGITNGNITANLPTNAAFHHLAGTYDGAFVRLYVDGKIVAEEPALGTIATTGGNLHIGLKTPVAPPGDGFFGVMDEVVLYDRGLNPTEVARLATGVQPL
jgi:hypothetical protein